MKKPLATIAALAIALSAFAQTTPSKTIKIRSKGDDIRKVIDSVFEQSGKQYILESNVYQTIYMSLDDVTFDKAVEILSNIAELEFEEKQGVWHVHSRIKSVTPTVKTAPVKTPVKTAAKTTKPAEKMKPLPIAKSTTSTQKFAEDEDETMGSPAPKPIKVDLTGRLTVQMKKMDIREVFGEFGRQTKIDIEIDENVPNYKLDAYFYNTSLKFALDKICKIANLKYTFTPSKTVRISKA